MNYNKNDLIDECLIRYYQTFACTLDTADYVPKKYNSRILLYIFKNLKKQFKRIDREDRQYQSKLKSEQMLKQRDLKKQQRLEQRKLKKEKSNKTKENESDEEENKTLSHTHKKS